jgi:GH24 family phage-related lysozyme (muramidase)
LSCILALTACSTKDEPENEENTTGNVTEGKIILSEKELQFDETESTHEVSFTANVEWTAKSDAAWLSLSPATGASGSHKLTLTAQANEADAARSAKIVIKTADGKASDTVTVKQRAEGNIILSEKELQFDETESTHEVSFTANVEWTAKSDAAWLSLSPATGASGSHKLTLTAQANDTDAARSAKIVIETADGKASDTVTVKQRAEGKIILSEKELQFDETESTHEVSFTANVEWTAKSDAAWLSFSPATGASGSHKLTLTAQANDTNAARGAKIVIETADGKASDTLIIWQKSKEYDYFFIDGTHELSESLGEWDAAILGVDGTSYWCKFSGDLPEKLVIWDNSGETGTLQCSILFDGEGLPHRIMAGEYAFLLTNFSGKTFDMAIFHNGEYIGIERELASDMDWDAYVAERKLPGMRKISYTDIVKILFYIKDVTACAISLSVGAAIPAVFNCGNVLITIIDVMCDCVPPELEAIFNCGSGAKRGDCIEYMAEVTMEAAAAVADYFDRRPTEVEANLTLDFTVDVTERNISFFSADAIVTVKTYPGWIQSTMRNEFGIFYGTKPTLDIPGEERKRRRLFDSSSGDKDVPIPERITLGDPKEDEEPLDPNTTYYYCTYIVYNGTLACGEIKSFKTKKPGLELLSPEQGAKVKPGESVDVEFYCFDPATREPLADISVHVESTGGSFMQPSKQTNREGHMTVYWSPDKSGASLIAQILGKKGNVLSQCVFTPNVEDEEEEEEEEWNLVGTHDLESTTGSKTRIIIYANGTFEKFYNQEHVVYDGVLRYYHFAGTYYTVNRGDRYIEVIGHFTTMISYYSESTSNSSWHKFTGANGVLWVDYIDSFGNSGRSPATFIFYSNNCNLSGWGVCMPAQSVILMGIRTRSALRSSGMEMSSPEFDIHLNLQEGLR